MRRAFSWLMPGHIRCILAAGGAGLVLALSLFAASPVAHGWLHKADGLSHDGGSASHTVPSNRDAGCPVEMFASGISIPLATPTVAPAELRPAPSAPTAPDSLFLASPRFLHQPERGPPMMG